MAPAWGATKMGRLRSRPIKAFGQPSRGGLPRSQVTRRGLAAALVALQLEAQLLAFLQAAQAGAFNGGDVDEDVGAAVVGLDESIALLAVEPLHGTGRHCCIVLDFR